MEGRRIQLGALYLVALLTTTIGCHRAVQRTPSSSVLGVEASAPQMVDGVYRVDAESTITQVYSPADMDRIPIGARCEVKLNTADRTLIGHLASVNTGILVLRDAEEVTRHSSEQGVPMMNKMPYFNRLFKNTGVASTTRPIGPANVSSFEIEHIKAHLKTE
jgi:hypothetical protein